MQFIICRNGDIESSFHESVGLNDIERYLKTLYVKHQTQEIYFRHSSKGLWMKPEYKFSVRVYGPHPIKVDCKIARDEDMPQLVRMRLLTGAI